jgi:hypothetical protein
MGTQNSMVLERHLRHYMLKQEIKKLVLMISSLRRLSEEVALERYSSLRKKIAKTFMQ